jgi:hypothetical protein
MGELTEKENIMQNFDKIDKEIFEKKQDLHPYPVQSSLYFSMNQMGKSIRLSS